VSNGRMITYDKLEKTWTKTTVAYFKALTSHLPERSEERHGKPLSE
jgi:hypothetical protein